MQDSSDIRDDLKKYKHFFTLENFKKIFSYRSFDGVEYENSGQLMYFRYVQNYKENAELFYVELCQIDAKKFHDFLVNYCPKLQAEDDYRIKMNNLHKYGVGSRNWYRQRLSQISDKATFIEKNIKGELFYDKVASYLSSIKDDTKHLMDNYDEILHSKE